MSETDTHDNPKKEGRGAVDGLETRHPISSMLPGLYQEDDFTRRLTSGFDEVLAPLFCTLDNLEAYFDPELAPMDFVKWLSGWVGALLDETWPTERQRAMVRQAAELYRWRGTVRGLSALVALYTGREPEIVDSGGAEWSPIPTTNAPRGRQPRVKVRVVVSEGSSIDPHRLDRVIAAFKPAHVLHEVEVVRS
jgi:phage tail-like protein